MGRIDIHVHHHDDDSSRRRLDCIEQWLHDLKEILKQMALDLTKINAELTQLTDAEVAVEALLTKLNDALKAIPPSTDPVTQAAIDDITTKLATGTDALVAATLANTPAAPTA